MVSEFKNCQKCGTRNFADDKVCGICKTRFPKTTSSKTVIPSTSQPINYKAILLIIGVVLFCYYAFIKESDSKDDLLNESYSESYLDNSPETMLAIINDHSKKPKQNVISQFAQLLNSLNAKYSKATKREISNSLVAAYNMIKKDGNNDSLLELTIEFDAFSKELDSKFNLSVEEAISMFFKMVYYN